MRPFRHLDAMRVDWFIKLLDNNDHRDGMPVNLIMDEFSQSKAD